MGRGKTNSCSCFDLLLGKQQKPQKPTVATEVKTTGSIINTESQHQKNDSFYFMPAQVPPPLSDKSHHMVAFEPLLLNIHTFDKATLEHIPERPPFKLMPEKVEELEFVFEKNGPVGIKMMSIKGRMVADRVSGLAKDAGIQPNDHIVALNNVDCYRTPKKYFPTIFAESSRPLKMQVWRYPASERASTTYERMNFILQSKRLGLHTRYEGTKIVVVKATGKTKKLGITSGDEIVALNGKDVMRVGQVKFIAALKDVKGPLTVSIWRKLNIANEKETGQATTSSSDDERAAEERVEDKTSESLSSMSMPRE